MYQLKNGQILFKLGIEKSFLIMVQNFDLIIKKIDKFD